MADDKVRAVSHVDLGARRVEQQRTQQREKLDQIELVRENGDQEFQEWIDTAGFSRYLVERDFKELKERVTPKNVSTSSQASSESEEDDSGFLERSAANFSLKNTEMNARTLLSLFSRLQDDDSAESIMKKAFDTYQDHTLADDALDFLVEASRKKPALQEQVQRAKTLFNELYGREIRAGRNISDFAREFSTKGLGSPTALRDLYREIIGNPREAGMLFDELTSKFSYKQMKTIIDFILHSVGADIKSKGPSIDRAELHTLLVESRKLLSFLSLFQFFEKRMGMIRTLFSKEGLTLPPSITFELLARQLMRLIQIKYPSPEKVLQLAAALGISKELLAQIILFSQYRDAMRHTSPRLFKNEKHRQDLLLALLDALSDLEDQIENEDEEEEDEEEEK